MDIHPEPMTQAQLAATRHPSRLKTPMADMATMVGTVDTAMPPRLRVQAMDRHNKIHPLHTVNMGRDNTGSPLRPVAMARQHMDNQPHQVATVSLLHPPAMGNQRPQAAMGNQPMDNQPRRVATMASSPTASLRHRATRSRRATHNHVRRLRRFLNARAAQV